MEVCTVGLYSTASSAYRGLSNAGPSFSPGSGPGPGSCLFETVGRQASSFPCCARLGMEIYAWDQPGGPFWPASVFSTSTLCQSQPLHYLVLPVEGQGRNDGWGEGNEVDEMDTFVVPDL